MSRLITFDNRKHVQTDSFPFFPFLCDGDLNELIIVDFVHHFFNAH
jgi:hypothetical protein